MAASDGKCARESRANAAAAACRWVKSLLKLDGDDDGEGESERTDSLLTQCIMAAP
jgi:hypothetical protein